MSLTKQELRKLYKDVRHNFPEASRKEESTLVCQKLIDTEFYQKADVLFCYLSYGSELDTSLLIHTAFEDGKAVAVPRISGKDMKFYRIYPDSVFLKNQYGISESVSAEEVVPDCDLCSLMILPGLCYDFINGRIGYGGGYYDRYLMNTQKRINLSVVSLALSCQYYEGTIPMETHDIRPEFVLFP